MVFGGGQRKHAYSVNCPVQCVLSHKLTTPFRQLFESLKSVPDRGGREGIVVDAEVVDPPFEQWVGPLAFPNVALSLREERGERDGGGIQPDSPDAGY